MTVKIIIDKKIPEYQIFISGLKEDIEKIDFTSSNINDSRVGFVWENNMRIIPFGKTQYIGSRWFKQ